MVQSSDALFGATKTIGTSVPSLDFVTNLSDLNRLTIK